MKKIISLFTVVSMLFLFVGALPSKKADSDLNISYDNIDYEISDMLYGLSLEDISFGCDGGLVSNLVNNNSFEYEENSLTGWEIDAANYNVSTEKSMNENNKQYLKVTVSETATIRNLGFTEIYNYKTYEYNEKKADTADMGFKDGETYAFSAYFKNEDFEGSISVSLETKGNSEYYSFSIDDCEKWTKKEILFNSENTSDGALKIVAQGEGTFYIDFVSLVPTSSYGYGSDTWKYISLRTDLYEAVKELSPSFIKFPGGCLTEGDTLENLYNWKDTLGPLEERKQTTNIWSDDNNGRNYVNTNSMGYHEYFTLCDDLNAIPIPVVNAGIICQERCGYSDKAEQYKNGALTTEDWESYLDEIALRPGTEEWDIYVQNIFDLIEYANGDKSTRWGSQRIKNGHEEPFNMQYIAIGSKNWGEVYWRNFDALYNEIKEKYPDITVITNPGTVYEGESFDDAWLTVNSKYRDTVVDEQYYTKSGYLFNNNDRYDSYERSGAQVFVSGYAASSDIGTLQTKANLFSAVENASYLTGLERNGDVVKMVAYSPTFAKINAQCRENSLIWFDSQQTVLTPDYFALMLFSNNFGTNYITTDFDEVENGIYQSTTVDTKEQVIYVKLVNSSNKDKTVDINISGFENVNNPSVQYLSENFKSACNEVGESLKVAPRTEHLRVNDNTVTYEMKGLSVNVVRIPYGDNDGTSLYKLKDYGIVIPYVHPIIEVVIPSVLGIIVLATGVTILVSKYKQRKRNKKKE